MTSWCPYDRFKCSYLQLHQHTQAALREGNLGGILLWEGCSAASCYGGVAESYVNCTHSPVAAQVPQVLTVQADTTVTIHHAVMSQIAVRQQFLAGPAVSKKQILLC